MIRDISGQHIVKHFRTCDGMKYIVQWYSFGPEAGTVDLPQHI